MKRYVLLTLLILFHSLMASAMTVEDVPNPRVAANSYVQDSGGVLGSEYISLIDNIAQQLKGATTAELAVITVNDMSGETVEEFAAKLFKRFGIGMKDKDNGVLILFSLGDRKVRIEVGYGLEGVINDAKAGRILDVNAVPYFKSGHYARGLFETSRAVASLIAEENGIADFSIADPAAWPAQITPPEPIADTSDAQQTQAMSPLGAALMVTLIIMGIALGGIGILSLRVKRARAKAAKEKAMRKGVVIAPLMTWGIAVIALIVLIGISDSVFLPILAFISTLTGVSFLHYGAAKAVRKHIAGYRVPCPSCGKPMELIPEHRDDALLSPEEVAEEKVEGMDYEFWRCEPCDHTERFDVKLGGASKCPACSRRTLVVSTTVLKKPSYSEGGRKRIDHTCRNPKCGYHHSEEKSMPKLTRSSSSGGSSRGSSSGSFGGGSSGGGGSSRSW